MNRFWIVVFVCLFAGGAVSGCASCGKRTLSQCEDEVLALRRQLDSVKEDKNEELESARKDLARAFEKELSDYKAKLEMTERGLVLTFVSEVFFDSGKDVVKEEGQEALKKVATVLNGDVAGSNVAIEGHTDNDPIKYSGWKSNWELSVARSLAVLHYFVDECGISPQRLSANGYGEYRPVASNATADGKRKNRRVEIVILPEKIDKVKPGNSSAS